MGLTMCISLLLESAQCRREWLDVALPLLGWGAFGGLLGSLVSRRITSAFTRYECSIRPDRLFAGRNSATDSGLEGNEAYPDGRIID